MTMLRVAAIQMRSTARLDENVETLIAGLKEAAAQGAEYVQTPEMTGLIQKDPKALFAAMKPQDDDPILAAASKLAASHKLWLHIGSTPIDLGNGKAANRAALFAPDGSLATTYDKIHMFDVDLDNGESWRESAIYQPGEHCQVTQIGKATLGFGICYDVRFPHLFRAQALAGADILTAPAAFTRQTGEAHWHVLLRARAIENGAFLIAAAQGGTHEDGRETYGHTLIIDPWGKIIAEKAGDGPGVITADIDLAQVRAARGKISNLANARTFDGPANPVPKAAQ
ncbi:MAG: carbon-nitrogen hydrolase family protein [Pseudomonadota bacterium]